VRLRPISRRDARAWRSARRRNALWLGRWDATAPPGADARPASFGALVRRLRRSARRGRSRSRRSGGKRPAAWHGPRSGLPS
ncbi:hypothetical protein, partial [Mycobacterium tuberculosis]